MLIRFNACAVLATSAAFVYTSLTFAQAPVVDASADAFQQSAPATNSQSTAGPVAAGSAPLGDNVQGELFYQLQLLQQEVMQLRGIVEEQSNTINRMKEQNMERYIDLDRRIGELSNPDAVVGAAGGATQQTNTSVAAQAGEKKRYNEAYRLVVGKRFDEALDTFKQFLVDFPDGKYAPNSLYWLGELYQVVSPQDLEASRQAFMQLLDRYPAHSKAADAMYKLGKVHFQKGDKEKAREWMERVVTQYGNGVNAAADKARQFIKTKL